MYLRSMAYTQVGSYLLSYTYTICRRILTLKLTFACYPTLAPSIGTKIDFKTDVCLLMAVYILYYELVTVFINIFTYLRGFYIIVQREMYTDNNYVTISCNYLYQLVASRLAPVSYEECVPRLSSLIVEVRLRYDVKKNLPIEQRHIVTLLRILQSLFLIFCTN